MDIRVKGFYRVVLGGFMPGVSAIDGYKTYILAAIGIIVAVVGHYWGPLQIGQVTVPQFSWNDVLGIAWKSGVIGALRHGYGK